MKLPCALIRDLLPLYAENLCEPETRPLVEEHLSECEDCRQKLLAFNPGALAPVDSAEPLANLKRQIVKRRVTTAVMAALIVFVAVFVFFYRANEMHPIPWSEGLIEVRGVEQIAREPDGKMEDTLILVGDGRFHGFHGEMLIDDETGDATFILQGWGRKHYAADSFGQCEMPIAPVPDRVLYSDGEQSVLVWGEPFDGGVIALPRLVLSSYALIAAVLTVPLGVVWLVLRGRRGGGMARQAVLVPLAYVLAHLLIKDVRPATFFPESDLAAIVVTAAALYALITLLCAALRQRENEG